MPLVVNGRFTTRPISGVERYAWELLRCLHGEVRLEVPSRVRGVSGHLWEQWILPTRVHAGEWLFSPANTGPVMVRRQIVTIHDLSPLEHPEWFSRGFVWGYRQLWPVLARRVQGILTDSEFSRTRILARLRVPPEKVIAIPTGVNREMFYPVPPAGQEVVRAKYGLTKEFLLFVGTLQPRKNLPRLLAAWERLQSDFPQLELVIAGTTGPQFHALQLRSPPTVNLRFLGYVPETDLPALYTSALGLVHPSLYEGSGLTLFEAMACGCPVLAAQNTALPEVVGDAGVLFDPLALEDMTQKLHGFLSQADLRNKLRVEGEKRVSRFTWGRACDEFHEALHHFQVW